MTNQDLKYAFQDLNGWHIQTVDRTGDACVSALALDQYDYPHISYLNNTTQDLKYAFKDIDGWHTFTVDSNGTVGGANSIDVDKYGFSHISYSGNGFLKYAHQDAGGWQIESVDEAGYNSVATSIAVDEDGHPHIAYGYAPWYSSLKYAYKDQSGWHFTSFQESQENAQYLALALDGDGYPHISYNLIDTSIKYAYQDSTGWHSFTVDDSLHSDVFNDLALDPDGCAYIAYYSESGKHLRLARQIQEVTGLVLSSSNPSNTEMVNYHSSSASGCQVIYEWDFGDGSIYMGYKPDAGHLYSAIGVYTTTLSAGNELGVISKTIQINVTNIGLRNYLPIINR
jgi:hypothetical protein